MNSAVNIILIHLCSRYPASALSGIPCAEAIKKIAIDAKVISIENPFSVSFED